MVIKQMITFAVLHTDKFIEERVLFKNLSSLYISDRRELFFKEVCPILVAEVLPLIPRYGIDLYLGGGQQDVMFT